MKSKRSRVVVIGNAVADVVARPVDEVPRTGSMHPETVAYYPGGCANNVAASLARLGVEVSLVASIGMDVFGDALSAQWLKLGIDTQYVVRQVEPTGVTIVLVDSAGERRFISSPGANRLLSLGHVPDTLLDDSFALIVAGFFTVPALEGGAIIPFLEAARQRHVMRIVDPVGGSARERRGEFLRLLPYFDLALVNEDEGEKITGDTDPDSMARVLLAHGAPGVIVKLGSRGSRAYGVQGRFDVPPFPANSVDSTGAGDAYVATLIAALLRGDDFKRAIRWASAAGAATVETVGATGDWGTWTDLNEIVERSGEFIP